MPLLTFNINYNINTTVAFSPQDIKDKFLSFIPNEFGYEKYISDETIAFYIQAAQEQLESTLGIKLSRQAIDESFDYIFDDWIQWGMIKTSYPVQAIVGLDGYLAQVKQISYPIEWLSVKRTSDNKVITREFRLVPFGGTIDYNSSSALFAGSFYLQINWWRTNRNVPNYWQAKYITGFPNDIIPADILQALGMIATIPLLGLISDAYSGNKGLGFGVSSKSISIDGLSQSISSFGNGQTSIFGARIKQYGDALFGTNGKPGLLEILKDSYSAILMTSC